MAQTQNFPTQSIMDGVVFLTFLRKRTRPLGSEDGTQVSSVWVLVPSLEPKERRATVQTGTNLVLSHNNFFKEFKRWRDKLRDYKMHKIRESVWLKTLL
jgi:hypothetical protein